MESFQQHFTENEWEACLKVLDALKDEPFHNLNNQVLSGLITKIHKNAKKQNRQEVIPG
uniref:Uncharacterized protein n=1 Tax=Chryseobacterium endophyticum TaxID=1854762 RepID=A0AAU6WS50_9FLAO